MTVGSISLDDVQAYVEQNIGTFHDKRLESLGALKLKSVLKHKNPYLFRAKYTVAGDLVKSLLDAYLSSQEETLFGEFLEGVAIYICKQVYGGYKSQRPSLDLEFERDGIFYIVSIKSGPNWGNADQTRKMRENFVVAIDEIIRAKPTLTVMAVNGCCYGQDANPDKGGYFKYCGQDFWELISGVSDLYMQIVEPLGYRAKERNEKFKDSYDEIVNSFTFEFTRDFCVNGRKIDWHKLVEFNSSHPQIKERRSKTYLTNKDLPRLTD